MISGAKKAKFSGLQLLLAILLVAVLGFVAYNVWIVIQDSARDSDNREKVGELRSLSSALAGPLREATSGNREAFDTLSGQVASIDSTWSQLKAELSGEAQMAGTALANMERSWGAVKSNAEVILNDKDTILLLNEVAANLNDTLPALQEKHVEVVDLLISGGSPRDQIATAQGQAWLAERIGRNIDKMLAGGVASEAAADQFNQDARTFGVVLNGLLKGDTAMGISRVANRRARASLDEVNQQFEFVSGQVEEIYNATPKLFAARKASEAVLNESSGLVNEITSLGEAIDGLQGERQLNQQTALLGGGLAIVLVIMIIVQSLVATRRRSLEAAEENDRNQNALIRLLDEIGDLGEGDLTAEATVTEDFTGAIADSINYAIGQLRALVARIQDSAENVNASASETRATALQLSEASEHQAQEIIGASAAINEMAVTIDQVSTNASESAVVAERSVSIAKNGGEVVRDTIAGMDTIREQIQDTSKRIKRLGESSQEIGDIVSLINEIADQTNILALNAAIQASMAGEAGRGFAVVADEVQGLAERSAAATKQIASLVKTIQTDTNEAVSSMESTTTEVVKGADLAHNAGVALEEIENVSADLAELIQDISSAARQQAKTASHVSGTMNVIQEISSQTLSGTTTTASSVGELAEMAVDMRESVSGFKLPGQQSVASVPAAGPVDAVQQEEPDQEDLTEQDVPLGNEDFDRHPEEFASFKPRFAEDADQPESDEPQATEELVAMAEDIADTLAEDETSEPETVEANDLDGLDIAADADYLASGDSDLDLDAEPATDDQDFMVELDGDLEDDKDRY
ncbi:methyl-accepting chemotaxis protein [Porticoccus sp. GXU_MW_L64]